MRTVGRDWFVAMVGADRSWPGPSAVAPVDGAGGPGPDGADDDAAVGAAVAVAAAAVPTCGACPQPRHEHA